MAAKVPCGGQIRPDWYVDCGKCNETEMGLGSRRKGLAGREARKRGWILTRGPLGWVCPRCKEQR